MPDLRLTCDHFTGKLYAIDQPTRQTVIPRTTGSETIKRKTRAAYGWLVLNICKVRTALFEANMYRVTPNIVSHYWIFNKSILNCIEAGSWDTLFVTLKFQAGTVIELSMPDLISEVILCPWAVFVRYRSYSYNANNVSAPSCIISLYYSMKWICKSSLRMKFL